MDKQHCIGCYNDFYNRRLNCDGKRECWSLKSARLQTMYAISVNAPQDRASRFARVQRPSCYHQSGMCYYDKLPIHLT